MAYLLQPLKVGTLSLANRLVMPPMATAKADAAGKVSPAMLFPSSSLSIVLLRRKERPVKISFPLRMMM